MFSSSHEKGASKPVLKLEQSTIQTFPHRLPRRQQNFGQSQDTNNVCSTRFLSFIVCYNGIRPPTSSPPHPLCEHHDVSSPSCKIFLFNPIIHSVVTTTTTTTTTTYAPITLPPLPLKTTHSSTQNFPTRYAHFPWNSRVEPRPPTDTMSPI